MSLHLIYLPLLQDVFSTMGAGDIDAVGVNINNMGSFETVFDVIGEGSTAMVEDLIISDIDFTASDPPLLWNAVTIRENGMASFVDTTVSNSTNIRHVFSAAVSSKLDILRAQMSGLTGGRAVVSTIHGVLSLCAISSASSNITQLSVLFPCAGHLGCKCHCLWQSWIHHLCQSTCG